MNPFIGRLSFSLPAIGFRRFRRVTSQTVGSADEGDASGSIAFLVEEEKRSSLLLLKEIVPSLLLMLLLLLARLVFSFNMDFHSLTNFAVLELAPPCSLIPPLLLAENVNVIVSMEEDGVDDDVRAEERDDAMVGDETDDEELGGGGGKSLGAVKALDDDDVSVFYNKTKT